MTLPADVSLNRIVKEVERTKPVHSVRTALSSFYGRHPLQEEAKDRFGSMDSVDTDMILDLIFDPSAERTRIRIIGEMDRDEFVTKFDQATDILSDQQELLVELFGLKSFPETYFHPDIARALCATGILTGPPKKVSSRIGDTTLTIAFALMDYDKALPRMLAVAESHRRRNPMLYREETVEYTLLTFSYFGAKAANIREDSWFFLWRVFGSMMGLPPGCLHRNYGHAMVRMQQLHRNCPSPVQPYSDTDKLLQAFLQAFLPNEEKIREAARKKMVSKRMKEYLVSRNLWPQQLPDPTDG